MTSAIPPPRMLWLRTLARVAEEPDAADGPAARAFLGALTRRMAHLHGRAGLPRSLACIQGAAVARFLCYNITGQTVKHCATRYSNCEIALSHDGTTVFAIGDQLDPNVYAYRAADGRLLRAVCIPHISRSSASLVNIAVTQCGSVLLIERLKNTVLALSSDLELQWRFTEPRPDWPILSGLCASATAAYVAGSLGAVTVLCLRTRTVLRRFRFSTPIDYPAICYVETNNGACLAAGCLYKHRDAVILFCGVTGACLRRIQLPFQMALHGLCWRASTNELFVSAGGVGREKRGVLAAILDADCIRTVLKRKSYGVAVHQDHLYVSRGDRGGMYVVS